ncbi:Retrovirus-related Pol polyprotein from transposon 17.6, partial [Mucuna pruriens]
MSFGLKNVGATYQRAMVALFHDMMHKEIEVYVDDMIAKSKTPKQHIKDLRLTKYKLRLNPTKCTFDVKTSKLLGFVVNERGTELDPDKVKAIREMPVPKQNRRSKVNFIARFISQLIATCNPIFKLLQKKQKLEWDSECQKAFKKIKRYLENPPVLVPTVPRRPLILYLTVLEESMGYMLGQQEAIGKKEQAIYYLNKKFIDYEKRKHLSRTLGLPPLDDSQPLLHEFPDEHIMATTSTELQGEEWIMWFDGASNLLGNGIGVVLASPTDQCFPFSAKLGFDCTNNIAKYEACTIGLMMALEHRVKKLKVLGDLALVIYQLCGEWETRDAKLIPYHDHVKEIVEAFNAVTFHHIPHEENQMADAPPNLSVIVKVNEGQEMTIHRYLEKGEYPEGAPENRKRTLRRLASGFLLSGIVLYKRNTYMTLLRCEDERIIEEVQRGTFGTHANGHALARKILWTKMESDCYQHIKKCVKCHTYADHINVAPSALHNLTSP